MKKLKSSKLNQLGSSELEKREMGFLIGGICCACGCNQSSSTASNKTANSVYGYTETYGGAKACTETSDPYTCYNHC